MSVPVDGPGGSWTAVLGLALATGLTAGPAMTQAQGGGGGGSPQGVHIDLIAHAPLPACSTADVWSLDGRHALVARRHEGFAVVDIGDPANPVVRTIQPPGYPVAAGQFGCGDVKSDGRYAYVADESVGAGLFVYDLVVPQRPRLVLTLSNLAGAPRQVHNCWVDNGLLFAGGTVVDVSMKTAPRVLAQLTNDFVHDVVVQDGIAYLSLWRNGFEIHDVRIPAVPRLLAKVSYPNSLTHNLWPSEDGRTMYSTDERVGSPVGIWDLTNLGTPRFVGSFRGGANGNSTATAHNVYVRGSLLFVAYYEDGLRVADISNPTSPVEIASYDTYPSASPGCSAPFAGAWGAYPWRNDLVLVSDIDSGLYLLRLEPISNVLAASLLAPPAGGTVQMTVGYGNATAVPLTGFSLLELAAVNGVPLRAPLWLGAQRLAAAQSRILAFPLQMPASLPAGTRLTLWHTTGLVDPLFVGRATTLDLTIR